MAYNEIPTSIMLPADISKRLHDQTPDPLTDAPVRTSVIYNRLQGDVVHNIICHRAGASPSHPAQDNMSEFRPFTL